MAEVHSAIRRGAAGFERCCALKRMLPQLAGRASYIKKFLREARLTAALRHPNIRAAFDLGEVDGVYFIDLELVDGIDLQALIRRSRRASGPPPVAVTLTLLDQLCCAIQHMHTSGGRDGAGIVHRDISPGNIMITHAGQLKLIDLGIAESADRTSSDRSGQMHGKLGYLSPEAFRGRGVDTRTDLFSIGVIAHELLTARRLFRPRSDERSLNRIDTRTLPKPSENNPEVPRYLDEWVMRALEPVIEQRWQTAAAMLVALRKLQRALSVTGGTAHVAAWASEMFDNPSGRLELAQRVATPSPGTPCESVDDELDTVIECSESATTGVVTIAEDASEALGQEYVSDAETLLLSRHPERPASRRPERLARGTSQPAETRSSSPSVLSAGLMCTPRHQRLRTQKDTPVPELLAAARRPDRFETATMDAAQQQQLVQATARSRPRRASNWMEELDHAISTCLAPAVPDVAPDPAIAYPTALVPPVELVPTQKLGNARWLVVLTSMFAVVGVGGYALFGRSAGTERKPGERVLQQATASVGTVARGQNADAGAVALSPDAGIIVIAIETPDAAPLVKPIGTAWNGKPLVAAHTVRRVHGGDAGLARQYDTTLCIDEEGRVGAIRVANASRVRARRIRKRLRTWQYQPYRLEGQLRPVCFSLPADVE